MKINKELQTYTQEFQALQADCDVKSRLKPSALARYVQQVATNHAFAAGFSGQYYIDNHFVFLLAKQSIEFSRTIYSGEKLRFETTPEKPSRASVKRITVIYNEKGDEVACVDSRWVLVDTNTHKILRRAPEDFMINWIDDLPRTLETRVVKAQTFENAQKIKAEYSMCDINSHINNAFYLDIMCNAVPFEDLKEKDIKFFTVSYHREVKIGQTSNLKIGKITNGYNIIGEVETKTAFEGNIIFR